jgi:hypothetical protein
MAAPAVPIDLGQHAAGRIAGRRVEGVQGIPDPLLPESARVGGQAVREVGEARLLEIVLEVDRVRDDLDGRQAGGAFRLHRPT